MKLLIKKFIEGWNKYNVGLYLSLLVLLAVGTINLVSTFMSFSWITLSYSLFCYLMMISRFIAFLLNKYNKGKYLYLLGSISLTLSLLPLIASLALIIMTNVEMNLPFNWIVYIYARYGFLKFLLSVINLVRTKYVEDDETNMTSYLSLVTSLFTLFMLETVLLTPNSENQSTGTMMNMQLITQALVVLM